MKRSLLSKLLAGIMSLGLVTGGSAIQNVCAMEDDYEEDYDDDEKQNQNEPKVSRLNRAFCIAGDMIPVAGSSWIHSCLGTPGETAGSVASWLLAYGAYKFGGKLVLSENEKQNIINARNVLKREDLTSKDVKTDESGNLVKKTNGEVVIEAEQWKSVVSETNKYKFVKYGPMLAVLAFWPIYDGVQLIRGR